MLYINLNALHIAINGERSDERRHDGQSDERRSDERGDDETRLPSSYEHSFCLIGSYNIAKEKKIQIN